MIYEAIVNDMDRWLPLSGAEVPPRITSRRRPDAVLLKPWIDAPVVAVDLRIAPWAVGSAMEVLAYVETPELPDGTRRGIRHALGVVFGAALRGWVDEPHW
ncbi:MAG: hypothetical protein ACRDYC_00765 [Acidimicrobiales bacterium]